MNKEGKEPEKEKEEGAAGPEEGGATVLIAPNDYQVLMPANLLRNNSLSVPLSVTLFPTSRTSIRLQRQKKRQLPKRQKW